MGRSYIKLLKLCFLKLEALGTSLVVLWLRLCSPNAEGPDLIPGQGTRVSNAGGDVEQKGLLFTAAGTTKWYSTLENSLPVSYKTKHPLAI